jgi:hypothetical protein
VHRPALPPLGVVHHAEAAEVQLALHAGLAVGDTHGRLPAPEPAPLRGEPVQRAIRHHHPPAGKLAVDVGQLQLVVRDPVADLLLQRQQRLPRRAVALLPNRSHRGDHRTDQLVGQLLPLAVADQTSGDRRLHIAPRGLAIHT